MKLFVIAFLMLSFLTTKAQEICTLNEIWQTDTILNTPESVLFYKKGGYLFVSNIHGKSGDKDGIGSIAKLDVDGKILNANWITGLNAPKGMGIYKNKLFVADLTEVVVIDISKGTVINKIPVDSSKFLNDISIADNGTVYVSDSRTGKVHSIKDNIVSTHISDLKGPNGLLAVNNFLYVLDRGSLLQYEGSSLIAKIADGMDASTDGIEQVKPNEFIVSCWSGVVYCVYSNGNKHVVLDTRTAKINSADIGYNSKEKVLYVPTFYGNKVVAYSLKFILSNFNGSNTNNKK